MDRRALLVVAMVALAGCSAFVGGEGRDTATLTPAPVPTPERGPADATNGESRTGTAAELSVNDLANPETLARQHHGAINETSYVWTERYVAQRGGEAVTARRSSTRRVTLENATTYRYETEASESGSPQVGRAPYAHLVEGRLEYRDGYETYASGGSEYRSWLEFDGGDRVVVRENGTTDRAAFDTLARGPIERYLAANATTVMPLDGRGTTFEITSTEPAISLQPSAENYSARAIVRSDGLVRELTVGYDRRVGNQSVSIRYHFEYKRVGTATVEPPEWLENARSELDDGGL